MNEIKEIAPTPNKHIIEELEGLLEQAKIGYIQGIVIATANNDASTYSNFIVGGWTMALLGEVRCIERDIIDCHVETRRKPIYEDGLE